MGLTTAAVIWTAAAIGMTTGIGYHSLAFVFTIITLIILILVDKIELLIGNLQKNKVVNIGFAKADIQQLFQLEDKIRELHLTSKRIQLFKENDGLQVVLQISGVKKNVDKLSELMIGMAEIKNFH